MYNELDHTKNPTIKQVQAFLNAKTHNVVIPSKSMSLKEAKTAINKRKGALNEVQSPSRRLDDVHFTRWKNCHQTGIISYFLRSSKQKISRQVHS
jgi:hypothetical protein